MMLSSQHIIDINHQHDTKKKSKLINTLMFKKEDQNKDQE